MGMRFSHPNITKGRHNVHSGFDGYAVTPSDTVDLPNGTCQALCVTGAAGTIAVQLDNDSTATLTIAGINEVYVIECSRVLATGTTATGIYALYRDAVPQLGG